MIRTLLIALAALLLSVSCKSGGSVYPEPPEKVRRVILVYMEARNNLSAAATVDLAEMRRAEIPSDCRLLVYKSISGEEHPTLVEIAGGTDTVLVDYEAGVSAVDPKQMRQVIADVRREAPSAEFGMVLWSHSSGWRQKAVQRARGYGLENSSRQMSISDLAGALRNQGIDFLLFDTCYMGSVEVAYELRDVTRWLVASVCEVPTDGMPYHLTVPKLFADTIPTGLKEAIDINVDGYIAVSEACPSTLSLIDLSKLDGVAEAMKAVEDSIKNKPLPEDFNPQRFSEAKPYMYLFYDLGQYMEALGADMTALGEAVVYERHSPMIWNRTPIEHCSGLSVYIPAPGMGYDYSSYDYSTLEWAKYLNLTSNSTN